MYLPMSPPVNIMLELQEIPVAGKSVGDRVLRGRFFLGDIERLADHTNR